MTNWWDNLTPTPFADRGNVGAILSLIRNEMARVALTQNGPPVQSRSQDGRTNAAYQDLIDYFVGEQGGRLVRFTRSATVQAAGSAMIVWPDTAVLFTRPAKRQGSFQLASTNPDRFATFWAHIDSILVKPDPKGNVHTIVHEDSRIHIKRLGMAGSDLIRDNYTPTVLAGYDRIVTNLNANEPAGRLAILDGPAGSGKTFMVRALLNDVKDAKFVLLPAGMAEQLAGPELLPVLLNAREGDEDEIHWRDDEEDPTLDHASKLTRLVLIMEDADSALVPRGADNMGLISTVLNLGDGILGRLLDLRVIATTNAKHTELDDAIVRPGRLMARVNIDRLDHDYAQRVLHRLVPGAELPPHPNPNPGTNHQVGFGDPTQTTTERWTLAELYDLAQRLQATTTP